MTVNVSLCGSIPRSEMMACSSHRSRLTLPPQLSFATSRKTDDVIAMAASSLSRKVSDDNVVLSSQVIEPPSWAVPARGEAILEVSNSVLFFITFNCLSTEILNVIYAYANIVFTFHNEHSPSVKQDNCTNQWISHDRQFSV